jgi:hypothetical protein
MFSRLQRDGELMLKSIIQLVYFMRGAISYNDMLEMTYHERSMVKEFIEAHLESQSKSPHPVY